MQRGDHVRAEVRVRSLHLQTLSVCPSACSYLFFDLHWVHFLLPSSYLSTRFPPSAAATSQASSQGLSRWLLNSKTLHLWGVIMRWAGSEGRQKRGFQNSCLRLRTSQYHCVALSGPIWAMLVRCFLRQKNWDLKFWIRQHDRDTITGNDVAAVCDRG